MQGSVDVTPAYVALLTLHILLIVAWLGMDIGTFTNSLFVRKASIDPLARVELTKPARILDMGPRTSLLLMYPVGAWLAYVADWGFDINIGPLTPPVILTLITLFFLCWLVVIWWQYAAHGRLAAGTASESLTRRLHLVSRWDLYARVGLAAALVIDGATALLGVGLIDEPWLAWKIVLFGMTVLMGVGIRLMAEDYPVLIRDIVTNGSTPERERALSRGLLKGYVFVWILWALIVAISAIAVAK